MVELKRIYWSRQALRGALLAVTIWLFVAAISAVMPKASGQARRWRCTPCYSAINLWSSENAGTFDLDAELEPWTRAGHIKIKVGKKADIRRLDMLIAHSVLGTQHS